MNIINLEREAKILELKKLIKVGKYKPTPLEELLKEIVEKNK